MNKTRRASESDLFLPSYLISDSELTGTGFNLQEGEIEMVEKDKGDMILKPLLVRFGVAVAISLAGFLFSRLRPRTTRMEPPSSPSPCGSASDGRSNADLHQKDQHADDQASKDDIFFDKDVDGPTIGLSPSCKNGDLLPGSDALVKEFDDLNVVHSSNKDVEAEAPMTEMDSSATTFRCLDKFNHQQEIEQLKTMVGMLKERERNLEVQLLEYYGLKEQETAVTELQNRLKLNNVEAKLLTGKIGSLQAENQSLKAQLTDTEKVVADLNAARSTIKVLKRKLRHEAEQNKEQILALQERVAKLQERELGTAGNGGDIEAKMQRLKVIQDEVEELKRANRRLQMENSELSRRLELAQMLANSLLEDHERLRDTSHGVLGENEELRKQIEQLQADRCVDAEELVYLRWINACLRYELRNYQPAEGKTVARDLSKALSPRSESKAKQLMLEYARSEGMADIDSKDMDLDSDNWSSPPASCITDSAERDESSVDACSATKTGSSSRNKLFSSLRKLVLGKHSHRISHVSFGKMDYTEQDDFASCSSSTAVDHAAEQQNYSYKITPSHRSSTSSFEIQRPSFVKAADMKTAEKVRSNSDLGSFYEHRRLTVDGIHSSGSTPAQRSDLVKFAQVLTNKIPQKHKAHKKSASYSFS